MTHPAPQYTYCDFFHIEGDRASKWRRIPLADLAAEVTRVNSYNCYRSVQTFASASPIEGDEPEPHFAPPYADFDAPDVADAQRDVLALIEFMVHDIDVPREAIRVWYSGKKGFHVVFAPGAWGITPSRELTYIYKRMFGHLAEMLPLPTLDMSVYTRRRMWRVPNTVHASTNLYKRELDDDEITLTPAEIAVLAKEPRPEPVIPEATFASFAPVPRVVEFYQRFVRDYQAEAAATTSESVTLYPHAAEGDPVCVQDIMGNGLKKSGDRNKATLSLGGYYKDVGRPFEQARDEITQWALAQPAGMRNPDDRHVKANTASVLRTVYSSDNYKFSCKFMRSLHGPKTEGSNTYDRVSCLGDACPFINPPPEVAPIPEVHLSKVSVADAFDKVIRTRLRVAGRQQASFFVPNRVTYIATDADSECSRPYCLIHASGGKYERNFIEEGHPEQLLAFADVDEARVKTALRNVVADRSCKAFRVEVQDVAQLVEMTVVPKAESVFLERGRSVDETGSDYVHQRAFGVNLDFKVNAYYTVTGKVCAHPRSQRATLVITEAEPAEDVIEDFDLDAARPLFKPYEGSTEDVLGRLVADVAINVTKVAGRDHALLAMLMALHSPLTLTFDSEPYGGWMQLVMVGDTGEAKSQLIERLVRHIRLGELLSAQSSGRTGLLYSIVQKESMTSYIQWGSMVLNDRRILIIDEASGLEKSAYAELRNARRDGVFRVDRSVAGEAQTRTRLIVLSNPRWGKNLSEFPNGINALEPLFENADIRRFDLAVGLRAGQVDLSDIETILSAKVPHEFTSDVLRANVLWAWSRRPEQIVWSPAATARVKFQAKRLNATYAGSDIHLLSQDANEKIARMSQALAATLHSTDESHESIVVTPEHVDFVAELVDAVYSSSDLGYELFVRQSKESSAIPDYVDMLGKLEVTTMTYNVDVDDIIDLFATNASVTNFALEAVVGDAKDARQVAKKLLLLNLIHVRRNGLEATTAFRELIRQHARRKQRALVSVPQEAA